MDTGSSSTGTNSNAPAALGGTNWKTFLSKARIPTQTIDVYSTAFDASDLDIHDFRWMTKESIEEIFRNANPENPVNPVHVGRILYEGRNQIRVKEKNAVLDEANDDCNSMFPSSPFYVFENCSVELDLRRKAYRVWSNTKALRSLFVNTIKDIQVHFKKYYVHLDTKEDDNRSVINIDMLHKLLQPGQEKPDDIRVEKSNVVVEVNEYPLSTTILVSENILPNARNQAYSKMDSIGGQHIVISTTVEDSSTAPEASSTQSSELEQISDTSQSSTPLDSISYSAITQKRKKSKKNDDGLYSDRKICQIAKDLNYDGVLEPHMFNATTIDPTSVGACVDVLIFVKNQQICRYLSKFLGIIFLEDSLAETVNSRTLHEMLNMWFRNPRAKSYRLLQNVIGRRLMFGRSNICLTSRYQLFFHVNANTKGLIYLEKDREECYSLESCMDIAQVNVGIKEPDHILKYVDSVTEIVHTVLHVNLETEATFYCSKEKIYYEIPVPLYSVIPLYILKFYSQLIINDPKNRRFSFNSLL